MNNIMHLPEAFIFDFDGVLSNNSKREHLLHQKNKTIEQCKLEFYEASATDDIYEDIFLILRSLYFLGYKIIIITARSEIYNYLLEEWFFKYDIKRYIFKYFTRSSDDNSEFDWNVKYKIYKNYIENKFKVCGVFEDNEDCIEMYRNAFNLPCYLVKH